ncbi:kelch-like protein 10 [Ixodes scapularis]|uniref:kelch-like protein 10 n=1 Tax=Ixodes scapularis TaxID=6945 RepID=UPI001C38A2ED|nr:kelch-like protein 10 [Ixodes scapularis]
MDLPASVIATFQNLRRIEKLFDAVLRTDDGTVFKVHRLVLAAACPLFKALFMADQNNLSNDVRAGAGEPPSQEMHEYWLTDISRETLALLIDFCYGVPLEERVRLDTVQYILGVAEKYKIPKMLQHCIRFLRNNLDYSNCVDILHLATGKHYQELADDALTCIVRNFDKVWTGTPAYTTLSSTELIRVVQSDELQVVDEVSGTFRAIMRWVEANSEHHQADLAALLGHVRFGFCKSRCFYTAFQPLY